MYTHFLSIVGCIIRGSFNKFFAIFDPPPLHGQFLYPERGQKQTFFDPLLPPHLVHVVIEWPLIEIANRVTYIR